MGTKNMEFKFKYDSEIVSIIYKETFKKLTKQFLNILIFANFTSFLDYASLDM
jgi:hypothetical protein